MSCRPCLLVFAKRCTFFVFILYLLIELSKRTETYNTTVENKTREIQTLTKENQALTNDLNDVKLQLEVKVHSLKEKLIDNENLTDKLKMTYECQIDNLNVMITKLSNYLKDKTSEYEAVRKEKEKLVQTIEEKAQGKVYFVFKNMLFFVKFSHYS